MTAVADAKLPPLMSRMAHDLEERGSLRASTAVAMYVAYAGHVAATGWALSKRAGPLSVPARPARLCGAALAVAGAGMCLAGMSRFAGGPEVTGTRTQELLTHGVYRYSGNPQYLGYLLTLGGAGVWRRSGAALASTAVLAAVYSVWIPVEEGHLTRLYGPRYAAYAECTCRWWGARVRGG